MDFALQPIRFPGHLACSKAIVPPLSIQKGKSIAFRRPTPNWTLIAVFPHVKREVKACAASNIDITVVEGNHTTEVQERICIISCKYC